MKPSLLLAALGIATAASADAANPVTITYTGIVSSAYDSPGLFGAGASLVGKSITASYRFDPTKGAIDSGGNFFNSFGGSSAGIETPSLGAIFTLNGHAVHVDGSFYAQFYASHLSDYSQAYEDAKSYDGTTFQELTTSVSADADRGYGSPAWAFDGDIGGDTGGGTFTQSGPAGAFTAVTFQNVHLRISDAVPEPASWVMMIAGFGMVGGALRKGRRTTVAFG